MVVFPGPKGPGNPVTSPRAGGRGLLSCHGALGVDGVTDNLTTELGAMVMALRGVRQATGVQGLTRGSLVRPRSTAPQHGHSLPMSSTAAA